jgi:plastocyanin
MNRTRTSLAASALLAAALTLSACAGTGNAGPAEPVELNHGAVIAVDDNDFDPKHAVVPAGSTVTWEWVGNAPHNVVGDDFESDVIATGTLAHTFNEPGTYSYSCTLHPGMDGMVEVTG